MVLINIKKNSIIKLTDDKLYYILETLEYNNSNYIYIIEKDNPMNLKFYREDLINNQISLKVVEDKEELNQVMKRFYEKMKKNIQKNNGKN